MTDSMLPAPLIPVLTHTAPEDWARRLQLFLGTLDKSMLSRLDELLFLQLACMLAEQNISGKEAASLSGGPFGAVIVSYATDVPQIIAAATNQVVTRHDPSAHAEICALREAATHLQQPDLSQAVLYSSCECCPQCQGAATLSGIRKVVYANDREQAAAIGFSDAAQYGMLKDLRRYMTSVTDPLYKPHKEYFSELLQFHAAYILDAHLQPVATGDAERDSTDITKHLPSLNAVRNACRTLKHYHLPAGYILLTRQQPHPVAFMTADWARIGYEAGAEIKTRQLIIYEQEEFEQVSFPAICGMSYVIPDPETILADMQCLPSNRFCLPSYQTSDEITRIYAAETFRRWQHIITFMPELKY